jgi:hypothetical protein
MKKRLAIILLAVLLAPSLYAQQATLATPETTVISATKTGVFSFAVLRECALDDGTVAACGQVSLDYLTSTGEVKRRQSWTITGSAALSAFVTAIGAPHAVDGAHPAETGTPFMRMNYRIMEYLYDTGRLPAGAVLSPT